MHADAEDDQCSVLLYYSENDPTKWQNRELGKNELGEKKSGLLNKYKTTPKHWPCDLRRITNWNKGENMSKSLRWAENEVKQTDGVYW